MGGGTNKIEQFKDFNFDGDKAETIMSSSGPYFKIKYDKTGRFIAGVSTEEEM